MEIYTEIITLKISKTQKNTLDKSKIEYCPFSGGTIILKT